MKLKITDINAETLKQWIDEDSSNILLIDVREKQEFSSSYISGAQFFPLSSFNSKEISAPKNKKLVFYCAGGVRSMKAANSWGQEFGEGMEIYNLEGGINKWKESGFSTVTNEDAKDKVLGQGHFLLGMITFFGSFLSLFGGVLFLLFPFFASFFLLTAAFKGAVYLEIFVAKMEFFIPTSFR